MTSPLSGGGCDVIDQEGAGRILGSTPWGGGGHPQNRHWEMGGGGETFIGVHPWGEAFRDPPGRSRGWDPQDPPSPYGGGSPMPRAPLTQGGAPPFLGPSPRQPFPFGKILQPCPTAPPLLRSTPQHLYWVVGGAILEVPHFPPGPVDALEGAVFWGAFFFGRGGGAYAWMLLLVLKAR